MEKILDEIFDKIIEKQNKGVQIMWAVVKGVGDKNKHLLGCDEKTEKNKDYTEYNFSLIDTDTFNKVKISVRFWKENEEDKYSIDISDMKENTVGLFDDIESAIDNALYVLEHGIIKPVKEQEEKQEEIDNDKLIKALEYILRDLKKEGK